MLMVLWSGLISFVFGLLLGVVLTVTKPNGILENKVVYQILDKLVSLFACLLYTSAFVICFLSPLMMATVPPMGESCTMVISAKMMLSETLNICDTAEMIGSLTLR